MTFPLRFLPYRTIGHIASFLGIILYYLLPSFRKKTLANIALAKSLQLTPKEIETIAKKSFINLATVLLEYVRFDKERDFSKIISIANPELFSSLHNEKKGVIVLCGHQSNWEALFLEGNRHMKGVAIGKKVKNPYLDNWVRSIREKTGGSVIYPKNALKEGLKAIKSGQFFGIVGDQAMTSSSYFYPFLGRKCYFSTAPALLSYKTNTPLFIASIERIDHKYTIHILGPLLPDITLPMEEEIPKLMDKALILFEKEVKKKPEEHLWLHNRYKQPLGHVCKKFRQESVAMIFSNESLHLISDARVLLEIYKNCFITVFIPRACKEEFPGVENIIYFDEIQELLKTKTFNKMVFDFSLNRKVSSHFAKTSLLMLDADKICKEARKKAYLSDSFAKNLQHALCQYPNP